MISSRKGEVPKIVAGFILALIVLVVVVFILIEVTNSPKDVLEKTNKPCTAAEYIGLQGTCTEKANCEDGIPIQTESCKKESPDTPYCCLQDKKEPATTKDSISGSSSTPTS